MEYDPKEVMRDAMSSLSSENRANLKYHAEAGTRILCGKDAFKWVDGEGGGWPAALATGKVLPSRAPYRGRWDIEEYKPQEEATDIMDNLTTKAFEVSPFGFMWALEQLKEEEVREIMRGL